MHDPDPTTPAPEPAADQASTSNRATGQPVPAASVAASTADPDDDWLIDDDGPDDAQTSRRGARAGDRRVGVARLVAAALVIVVAFAAGIGVGRVTAPAAADGAAAAPATGGSGSSPAAGSPAASSAPDLAAFERLPSDGPLLGSATAKVRLAYWADYQCPFCSKLAATVLPALASRIADGTVALEHHDFAFLGPESVDAAVAVRCAGEQGKYWPMHDAVYAAQNGENQGAFTTTRLAQIAAAVGVDAASFAACQARHDVLVTVLADTEAGVQASVASTPTLDLPGKRFLGVPDAATLLAAVDAAAASGAAPTPAPSVAPSGDPWAGTATSGRTAGGAAAPVTVELWVDYQAPGMSSLVQTIESGLRARVASGRARLVLRDLATFGAESVTAAAYVRCTANSGGPAWFANDLLGSTSAAVGSGVFTSRNLLWLAARLGDDVKAIDACMADPATADAIAAETAVGKGLGLTTAPAVVVTVGDRETAKLTGSLVAARVLAAVDGAK